jgi:hypothetical protein
MMEHAGPMMQAVTTHDVAERFLQRDVGVEARWESSEGVLLIGPGANPTVLVTDERGLLLLWMCDGTRRGKDILRELGSRYALDLLTRVDVMEFLDSLVTSKMVALRDEPVQE